MKFEFKLNNQIAEWSNVDFHSILAINQVDSANMTTGLISQMVAGYSVGYKPDLNRFWVIVDYVNYDM